MDSGGVCGGAVGTNSGMGSKLRMEVEAERVGRAEVAQTLADMGVRGLQCYGIERTQPLERLTLANQRPVRLMGTQGPTG